MGFFTLFGCVQTNAMLSLEKCNFCLVVLYVVHVVRCCMSLTFLMNWGIVLPRFGELIQAYLIHDTGLATTASVRLFFRLYMWFVYEPRSYVTDFF
jgi:hypothetical protein